MQATQDAIDFTPPRPKANLRALGLAIFAHLLLLAALTWGVSWKSTDTPAVEAEIWSSVTQQAAPRAVEEPVKPVEPPPQPKPDPTPPPPPPRVEPKVEPPPVPKVNDADIALERDKKRKEIEKQKELEEQRQELAKQKELKEQERLKKVAADKKRQEQKRLEEEEDRREQAEADAKRKKADAADAKRKAGAAAQTQKDKAQAEALRQENLKRMQGLAGASGGANATGTALKSSGPSSSYGGKVAAKVRPNIVFPDDIAGNPVAEMEVRAAPDGTITGKRITKSSGFKAWDDAVIRALEKTETLPRDVDGRVPSVIIITFKPKDD